MAVFLIQFMVLDCVLSWPSSAGRSEPQRLPRGRQLVHRLNWSPPAKALNTSAVVVAMLVGWVSLALAIGVALTLLKAWSAHRVLTLRDWS